MAPRVADVAVFGGWGVQAVDLTASDGRCLAGSTHPGQCSSAAASRTAAKRHVRAGGALLFPTVPDVPFDPYRAGLYTPDELYAGLDDDPATPDARVHAWSRGRPARLPARWPAALHDDAIVGRARRLGREPARRRRDGRARARARHAPATPRRRCSAQPGPAGFTVATGGGPGAMEAANLGAYLAPDPDDALDAALRDLAAVPSFRPDVTAWARAAFDVRGPSPRGAASRCRAHLVLRARAAERLRHLDRQVLLQRAARGRVARPRRRRPWSSCPARPAPCRRSSRPRARILRGRTPRPDDPGGVATGPRPCPRGRCCAPRRGTSHGRARCTCGHGRRRRRAAGDR